MAPQRMLLLAILALSSSVLAAPVAVPASELTERSTFDAPADYTINEIAERSIEFDEPENLEANELVERSIFESKKKKEEKQQQQQQQQQGGSGSSTPSPGGLTKVWDGVKWVGRHLKDVRRDLSAVEDSEVHNMVTRGLFHHDKNKNQNQKQSNGAPAAPPKKKGLGHKIWDGIKKVGKFDVHAAKDADKAALMVVPKSIPVYLLT